jgi:oxygen-independent coproporphyrinogen-3 oxidase
MDLHSEAHARLVTQMHWGGGTPTYLDPRQITHLFNAVVTRFAVPMNAEISVEIDPRVTTGDHLKTLRFLGFNRISVGIQDFDARVQAAVRRIQSFEATQRVFEEARALGFESVNADLIYGLPMQTAFSFAKTLDQVLELDPDRIAVFSYAHVPSMKRQQRSFEKHLPRETEKLDLFLLALHRLISAGYEHIGMDHFARPYDPLVAARDNGTLHRNFQGYTTHSETDLLGFGVSAISHIGRTFTQNYRDLSGYHEAIRDSRVPVFRGYVLSKDDQIRATVIDSLLCTGTIRKEEIDKRFSIDFNDYFLRELTRLREFERDGLIEGCEGSTPTVTDTGRILVRPIAQVFDVFQSASVASKAV